MVLTLVISSCGGEGDDLATEPQLPTESQAAESETLTSAVTGVVASMPLVVAGPSAADYPENGTSTVASYSSDRTRADEVTWTLSGIDADVFAITAGTIEFRTPPNYENPADQDGDNEYRVEVVAKDSAGTSGTKAVAIKVTDVWDPNVVLFLADDVGYEAFGAYGSTQYRTPRLDEIAEAGVRFTNAYSKPGCTPSRVALMTGKSNVRNYADWSVLLPGEYTIADLFREAGYATAIAGKWQLDGGESEISGVAADESGFDTYCLWNTLQTGPSRYWDPSIECDGQVINRTPDDYGPDVFTDFLLEFVESNRDGPFFAYYPMVLPHYPLVPPPNAQCPTEDDKQCNFEDMVSRMDYNVGRIYDRLAALELLDNTILIFTSDNGTLKSLVSYLDGGAIYGDKSLPTDGGTRVPLIALVPGDDGGRVLDDLVDFTDVLPTLAEAVGVTIPEDITLDGVSFWEQLNGNPGQPREWIYTYYFPRPYKEIFNTPSRYPEVAYARDKRYKLYNTGELFDLSVDRFEIHPLLADHEESIAARTKLQAALDSMPVEGEEILWSSVTGTATEARPRWRPVLSGATVNGAELTLAYAGVLNTKEPPPADAFTVKVDGTERTVTVLSINAMSVVLMLASPVTSEQTVTVSYDIPRRYAIRHVHGDTGHFAAPIADEAVRNTTEPNSPAGGVHTTDGTAQAGTS